MKNLDRAREIIFKILLPLLFVGVTRAVFRPNANFGEAVLSPSLLASLRAAFAATTIEFSGLVWHSLRNQLIAVSDTGYIVVFNVANFNDFQVWPGEFAVFDSDGETRLSFQLHCEASWARTTSKTLPS
jgi:hypothetical protein